MLPFSIHDGEQYVGFEWTPTNLLFRERIEGHSEYDLIMALNKLMQRKVVATRQLHDHIIQAFSTPCVDEYLDRLHAGSLLILDLMGDHLFYEDEFYLRHANDKRRRHWSPGTGS
jgi:hypothetical protein